MRIEMTKGLHVARRVGLAFAVALALPVPAVAQEAETPQLTVAAEGRVTAAPDMATVTLGVRRDADTASEAVSAMSTVADGLLATLGAAGLAPSDIQTSGLTLSPRYARDDAVRDVPPAIVGYRAETSLQIRVRDLERLGPLLDTLVAEGSNLFRGLTFGLSDPGPLQDDARRAAVREAARQAELLADAAGVALGPLLRLDAVGHAPRPEMMRTAQMEMASPAGVPVAPGEVSLSARVSLVYALRD
ncbi:MAG: SIMPL domain-containing protein [Pseudomonadota bacterium]